MHEPTLPETATGRRGRVRILLRVVGLPLAIAALCLSLVWSTAPTAQALAVPPGPVTIGEALAAPAAEVGGSTVLAGGCLATTAVGCAAIVGGAVLIGALYATKDSWLPIAKQVLSDPFSTHPFSSGSCAVDVVPKWPGTPYALNFGEMVVTFVGCGANNGTLGLISGSVTCKTTSTGAVVTGSLGASVMKSGSRSPADLLANTGAYDFIGPVCATGQEALGWSYGSQVNNGTGTVEALNGQTVAIGKQVPSSALSQKTTVTCLKSDGTSTNIALTQLANPNQVVVPSCQAAFPGSVPTKAVIAGGYAGAEQPVATVNLTDPHSAYPDCFNAQGAFLAGSCVVRVWVNGSPCHVGTSAICTNWSTASTDYPDATVECKWGHYVVALSDCSMLQHAYESGAQVKTITKVDPKTGLPAASTDPGATDPSDTSSDTITGTGTNTTPAGDPGNDDGSGSCISGAFTFNPVDWVYVPVKCALKWAFVPSTSALDSMGSSLKDAWNASTPGAWLGAVVGQSWSGTASGCQGPPVTFSIKTINDTFHPMDACGSPMSTVAAICKTILTAGIVWYGGLACVRILGVGLGWNTGLGKGGDSA